MTAPNMLRTSRAPYRRGRHAGVRNSSPEQLNWTIAGLVPAVSFVLATVDPRLRHWMLIPVTVCGVLITVDAAEWFRRRTDVFDPRALIGLLGFHFFYLSPVLHVMLDYWAPEGVAPADWRNAVGSLAMVNSVGLLLYRAILSRPEPPSDAVSQVRPVDERVLHGAGRLLLAVGACAFASELVLFGGVKGFLGALAQGPSSVQGMGWLLLLADSFPLMAFVLVVIRWRRLLARRRRLLGMLLAGLVLTQFVVAGLRGSRTSTLWPVLVGVIVVHLLVTPVTRRAVAIAALSLGLFMYGYGLYKGSATGVLDVIRGERSIAQLSEETGRDLPLVLLGDLARTDVNARMLERLRTGEVSPVYGETYLGGPASFVPSFLLPERPRDKVEVGTDMILGPGSYAAGERSARAYGITGEAIMNFGVLGGVLSFAGLALAVRYVGRYYRRSRRSLDLPAVLLAPSLLLLAANLLLWDFGNMVWYLIKHVGPLALVVLVTVACVRSQRPGGLSRLGRGLATVGTPGGVAWWWAGKVARLHANRSDAGLGLSQWTQDDVLAQRPPAGRHASGDGGA